MVVVPELEVIHSCFGAVWYCSSLHLDLKWVFVCTDLAVVVEAKLVADVVVMQVGD